MIPHVLIVSPARSGSTSLREMLDRQPGVLCHGEILGPNRILGVSHKIKGPEISFRERKLDRPKFISTLLDRDDFAMTGFKALYEHFFLSANAYYLNWILSRSPKVIFLWRRNLVSRFRSECVLRVQAGHLSIEKLHRITEEDIVADARLQMEMAGWIMQRLEMHAHRHNAQVLTVDFEALISDPDETTRILEFLQIDAGTAKLGKDTRTAGNSTQGETITLPEAFETLAGSSLADTSLETALGVYNGKVDLPDR
jgi:hypothetical protein